MVFFLALDIVSFEWHIGKIWTFAIYSQCLCCVPKCKELCCQKVVFNHKAVIFNQNCIKFLCLLAGWRHPCPPAIYHIDMLSLAIDEIKSRPCFSWITNSIYSFSSDCVSDTPPTRVNPSSRVSLLMTSSWCFSYAFLIVSENQKMQSVKSLTEIGFIGIYGFRHIWCFWDILYWNPAC